MPRRCSRSRRRRLTAWRFLGALAALLGLGGCIGLILAVGPGCTEGAVQLAAAAPVIPAEAVKLEVQAGAVTASMPAIEVPPEVVSVRFEPGAIALQVDAPVQTAGIPEASATRLADWIGAGILVFIVGWFLPRPKDLLDWWRRRNGGKAAAPDGP